MSTGLTSRLSDVTRRSDSGDSSGGSSKPGLLKRTQEWFGTWLGKLVPSTAFARYAVGVAVGVLGTLAWQAYGGPARTAVAGWSPHLAWLAPAASQRGVAAERIKATSLALANVHQSVDKLTTEVRKLETQASSAAEAAASAQASGQSQSRRASRR